MQELAITVPYTYTANLVLFDATFACVSRQAKKKTQKGQVLITFGYSLSCESKPKNNLVTLPVHCNG